MAANSLKGGENGATVPASTGQDSVFDQIRQFNSDRDPKLLRLKYRGMDAGPFAFFRGTDHLFARAWPWFKPSDVGPDVLLSGDLHLENFGAYRGEDGVFRYDINDFDESVIGPSSFDLVRCATSTLLAAEDWKLSPVTAAQILWTYLASYRMAMEVMARTGQQGELTLAIAEGAIAKLLGATSLGSQAALLRELTERVGGRRRIVRGKKHPKVDTAIGEQVKHAVEECGARRGEAAAYQVLDVTRRVAGIGSLGVRRYAALVDGGGTKTTHRLLDLKQQGRPSILACSPARQPHFDNEAQRVVAAQRQLQARPAAGLDTIKIGQDWFRMRELVPDENRSGLERLAHKPSKLRDAVEVAGRITAWSHWRGTGGEPRPQQELLRWSAGPGVEAVIPAAIRYAAQTLVDYKAFHAAYQSDLGRSGK